MQERNTQRQRRHRRVRAKIRGTAKLPRLVVFRSNKNFEAQLVDDEKGKTLAFVEVALKNTEKAGTAMAQLAKEKKVTKVVFDRGGYKYHGNVKKFAESARKEGLQF
ncbi:MAG: 50S ribosomal protein L18 [Candidatus Wildermuthbacteria bacterium RIFCSPLOWO2_01_FULL_48_16]|uniref:Large ribosomal subunit protein uL18 n=1 Tax=Candidatus Wildermuthbacteria bacterium RIFCSPLOWO2_01_FULL_48_16 TaxID=1802461 RepID=A0A1G2RN80_9BACT|nr:MAG: 50S ribosomal protein L18 [Candidatus Wildermuthbacteria bacterium RIFCSPHIGHO2_02_FULL_49_12b]OHA73471.1 MAG: 50S ribosomal protein L18 [Candidatus Wildermuthbacteria bacterium RIFCSPLOWO2_01_FULL_48_16]